MNKLLFSEGGQPLHLDDLSFMQEAIASPLKALTRSWGNCILSGCELRLSQDNADFSWTEGYISFQGDIYRVSAGSLEQVNQSDTLFWIFTKNEEGRKVFEDGSENNTQALYSARLISTRDTPESGLFIAHDQLPRLGVDFARSPRLKYSYEGQGVLVEFAELSRYSGMLTLCLQPAEFIANASQFATFKLQGVNNMSGYALITNAPSGYPTSISLVNGKLLLKEERGDGIDRGRISITRSFFITLPISWDYEENNGAGTGINERLDLPDAHRGNSRSTYTGYGSTSSSEGFRGRH